MAIMHHAQAAECGERRVARGFKRGSDGGKFLGPVGKPLAHRLQRLIRRAGGLHHAVEIRRVKMARDKGQRFQRLQQRWQHGHDVVHHGLTHRRLPFPLISAAAAP